MSDDRKPDYPTKNDIRRELGADGIPMPILLIGILIWIVVVAVLLFGVCKIVWDLIWHLPPTDPGAVWDWRFSLAQLAALTTVVGAAIALPLTMNRLVLTRRQTEAIEEGQITDRINKAVEGLGAEKTVKVREFAPKYKTKDKKREKDADGKYIPLLRGDGTPQGRWEISEETQPNLEVRIGAIYALERIAQDSDRDHVQIMEILCAYIRQNAPAPERDDWPELEMKESEEDGPLEADWQERLGAFSEAQWEAKAKLKPREDIQVALTVIGRRNAEQREIEAGPGRGERAEFPFDDPPADYDGPEGGHDPEALKAYRADLKDWKEKLDQYDRYRLDLRDTDLRGMDLSRAELGGARLDGARLQGANLWDARMQGAVLRGARMHGADLWNVRLQGADLRMAQMQGADLRGARMQGADFWVARMQKANLSGARMQEADFSEARMQGASLLRAQMQAAGLTGAQMQGAILREARMQGVHLWRTRMQGTDLTEARMQGAILRETRMQGAILRETRMQGADLRGAAVKEVDLTNIPQITEHLEGMFGDASVTLPGGHGPEHRTWPPHWPKFELKGREFNEQWRAWLKDPENYTPPDPP